MVIFDTLGLAVPYIPRPPGENDSMKRVFLGGASAGGRGASGVSLGLLGLELADLWSFRLMWSTAQVAAVRFRRRLTPRERRSCSMVRPSKSTEGMGAIQAPTLYISVVLRRYCSLPPAPVQGRLSYRRLAGESHCEGYGGGSGVRLLHLSFWFTGGADGGIWGVSHARSSDCRHLFVRPNRYVSKPSACQRVQSDHAGARFDPAAAAPRGQHNSIMVSPEDCGAGGLTKCLPLSLLLDGPVL